ncbi:MAG TPA: hypothetical protein VL992_07395, partial [Tepidisphaeraceae bacterium]|nr:hypothetical protein [Tepidisphaeraceae bacterium]
PWGGGITTCDALWMGVPVITLRGRTAVGRGSVSVLCNLGLPELVAETPRQYVELACAWEKWIGLRATMRERMIASPLLDAQRFSADLAAAFRSMWRNWCLNTY